MPFGWTCATIGKLFTIVGGGTPSTLIPEYWGAGIPWFSSADIDEIGTITPRRCVTKLGVEKSTVNIVPADSVIVVTRVGLGKVAILNAPMCFSQDNHALVPRINGLLDSRFLYRVMFHEMQILKHSGRGTTISGITKKQLEDISIQFPPLAEQKRIVQKIENAFAQLNSIMKELN